MLGGWTIFRCSRIRVAVACIWKRCRLSYVDHLTFIIAFQRHCQPETHHTYLGGPLAHSSLKFSFTQGSSPDVLDACSEVLCVPQIKGDSLSAVSASSICLYELQRLSVTAHRAQFGFESSDLWRSLSVMTFSFSYTFTALCSRNSGLAVHSNSLQWSHWF